MKIKTASYRNCPLCDNSKVSVLGSLKYLFFDDCPLSDRYDVVSCTNCGFPYYDTSSSEKSFLSYYSKNAYYLANIPGSGGLNDVDKSRYKKILDTLTRHTSCLNGLVLDAGSAKGGLLVLLKEHGYNNLLAIDLLPKSVAGIRKLGINAEIGDLCNIPTGDGSAHAVILSHVLEHVPNLKTALCEVKRVISHEGIVYVEVPCAEDYHLHDNEPLWDFLYEHINHFSQIHLNNLFENFGFSCVEHGTKRFKGTYGKGNCLYALFRKSDMEYRHTYCNVVSESISKCFALFSKSKFNTLEKIASERTPCYVWGLSSYMHLLLAMSPLKDCNIVAFLDRDTYKQQKKISGLPVKSPEALLDVTPDDVVVIPAGPYIKGMKEYFQNISCKGKLLIA
ncbi:MAG: methyltransferase domain-containing protein [Candidatus Scalindua sp.]|jgi:SAM-dependent methyltransferase|nr:methyltransferase domain-containing protein [Candidatus Scalindua sp.]MBT6049763.1 methyltransferase domain-containing protein [Candidatus Scalindua sp.]MBT6565133.1 methyltransferase domain-containing protein [Candidatus Scalindua sp.]MBT7211539.1 methyltransferase domain-containing protein [Candidatus Scalindua sp.]MBT7590769.1 methyltransferase domain-containing protein [Candidatus Scalindua sp.]